MSKNASSYCTTELLKTSCWVPKSQKELVGRILAQSFRDPCCTIFMRQVRCSFNYSALITVFSWCFGGVENIDPSLTFCGKCAPLLLDSPPRSARAWHGEDTAAAAPAGSNHSRADASGSGDLSGCSLTHILHIYAYLILNLWFNICARRNSIPTYSNILQHIPTYSVTYSNIFQHFERIEKSSKVRVNVWFSSHSSET